MLNKRSCQLCHQKHEQMWEEEMWGDGYVSCPRALVVLYRDGRRVDCGKEHLFLKTVYGFQDIKAAAPLWCEYPHGT